MLLCSSSWLHVFCMSVVMIIISTVSRRPKQGWKPYSVPPNRYLERQLQFQKKDIVFERWARLFSILSGKHTQITPSQITIIQLKQAFFRQIKEYVYSHQYRDPWSISCFWKFGSIYMEVENNSCEWGNLEHKWTPDPAADLHSLTSGAE